MPWCWDLPDRAVVVILEQLDLRWAGRTEGQGAGKNLGAGRMSGPALG